MAILISDSFKIRESTSDEWKDILFSINSPGVPAGGSTGQVLVKVDGINYNTQWINFPDPSGYVSYAQAQTLTAAQQMQARGNIGANWVLLWENASPTSNFAAQTITFDYSAYSFLAIIIANSKTEGFQQTTIFENKENGGFMLGKCSLITGGMYFQYRKGALGTASLDITDALEGATSKGGTTNPAEANHVLIPIAIYGIKN